MNMDREQEPLDQDTGLDGDSEQGWYFDLPKGAWERQEQKNRELRDRVLRNIQSEPDRADPFAARRTSPQQQPEEKSRGGLFGLGKRKQEPEKPKETPGGTWRLNRGGASFDNLRPVGGSLAEDPDEYSTEPTLDVQPIPLRLRSREQSGDDGRPPLRFPDDGPASSEERPASRWDDAFASPAEGGMLQGMASWAKDAGRGEPGSDDDQPRPRRVLRAVPNELPRDSEPPAEPVHPDAEDASAATILEPEAHGAVSLPASSEAEFVPSGWAEASALPATEPPASESTPGPAIEEPAVEETTPAFELKLRRPSGERTDDEPETDAEAPRSRWDEVFSAPAGDAGMLESMRAWASKPAGEEEPAPRRLLADPEEEPIDDGIATDAPEHKRRGLFGRLFGRKSGEPLPPEPAAPEMAWLPPADEDHAETTPPSALPSWLAGARDEWEEHQSAAAPAIAAERPSPAAVAEEDDDAGEAKPVAAIAEQLGHGGWEPTPVVESKQEPASAREEETDEEPDTTWMLPAPADELEDEPFAATHTDIVESDAAIPAPPKKKSLFGRMFGRAEHTPEIIAGIADASSGWTPATSDDDREVPAATVDNRWPSDDEGDWVKPTPLVRPATPGEPPFAATDEEPGEIGDEFAAAVDAQFSETASQPPEAPASEPATPWAFDTPMEVSDDGPLAAGAAIEEHPAQPAEQEISTFEAAPVAAAMDARSNESAWQPPEAPASEPATPWAFDTPMDDTDDGPLSVGAAIEERPAEPAEQEVSTFEAEPAGAVDEVPASNACEPSEPFNDEPAAPWMLPANSAETVDEMAGPAAVIDEVAEVAEAPRKKGLFGRMFGHKEHTPEGASRVADESSDWVAATDDDIDAPDVAGSRPWTAPGQGAREESADSDAPPGAWEQPSDWSAPAAGLWEPAEPAPSEPPESNEHIAEPSLLIPVADAENDDFSWDPEPFEPAEAAPVALAEAEDYSTEAPDIPASTGAEAPAGAPPVAQTAWGNGPWTAADTIDQPAEQVMAEEPTPAAAVEEAPTAPWEPEETPPEPAPLAVYQPDFASALFEREPETAPTEEPWRALASVDVAPPSSMVDPAAESSSWGVPQSESPVEQPVAEASEAAPEGSYDDPWANFDLTADRAEAPESAAAVELPASLAASTPDGTEDDPWATFMESREPEPPTVAEEREHSAAPAPDTDEPWAAIADASGYDPTAPIGFDAYRRASGPRQAPPDYAGTPNLEPAASLSSEDDAESLPEWARGTVEDDTILRAFEAHANAALDDERRAAFGHPLEGQDEPPAFEELLGEGGNELVSEVTDPESDHSAFSRLQGWAPQRNLAPGEVGAIAQWTAPAPSLDPSKGSQDGDEWSFDDDDQPPWVLPRTSDESGPVAVAVRRSSRARTLIRELVETGLLALLVFLAVRASFQNFKVDGNSMYPTLENGQFLIVNKLVYSEVDMDKLSTFVPFVDPGDSPKRNLFHGPQRGDIVVLRDPRKPDTDLIKRVIGLPGETIEIVNDEQDGAQVYINDHLLQEPYLKAKWHDSKPKIEIPDGYYFVMGDNRDYSLDSRSQQVGVVSKDNVIGKAMLSYWPKDKLGLAPNEAGNISEKDGRPQLTAQRIGE